MDVVSLLLLTTAISVSTYRSPAGDYRDAATALAKATYIETKTDKMMKTLEKKYVPKKIEEYGGWITAMTKIAVEKRVSLEWTF